MNSESLKILVAVIDGKVAMRLEGRANLNESSQFKAAVDKFLSQSCCCFRLDLTNCTSMDSTFVGTLVGYLIDSHQNKPEGGAPTKPAVKAQFELFNCCPRVFEAIDNLGVSELFKFCSDSARAGASGYVETAKSAEGSEMQTKTNLCKTSLEAHQALMQWSEENQFRFKDVARFLEEDLHRLESAKSDESNEGKIN